MAMYRRGHYVKEGAGYVRVSRVCEEGDVM